MAVAAIPITQQKPDPKPQSEPDPSLVLYSAAFKAFTSGPPTVTGLSFDGVVENKTGEPIQLMEFGLSLAGKKYPVSYAAELGGKCVNSPGINIERNDHWELVFFVPLPMQDMTAAAGDYFEPVLFASDTRGRTWNLRTVNENRGKGYLPGDPCYDWPS